MKLSDLIPFTSETLGLKVSEVKTVAYGIRPLGLLSSKGRGAGGAEMTSADAANLFLTCLATNVAKHTPLEYGKWTERCPGLIEHIESCIRNPPSDTSVEFDVDGYCSRFLRKDGRTKTFGKRPDTPSYLTRTVTAKAFSNWLEGLRD
jgi:hypothetical protein